MTRSAIWCRYPPVWFPWVTEGFYRDFRGAQEAPDEEGYVPSRWLALRQLEWIESWWVYVGLFLTTAHAHDNTYSVSHNSIISSYKRNMYDAAFRVKAACLLHTHTLLWLARGSSVLTTIFRARVVNSPKALVWISEVFPLNMNTFALFDVIISPVRLDPTSAPDTRHPLQIDRPAITRGRHWPLSGRRAFFHLCQNSWGQQSLCLWKIFAKLSILQIIITATKSHRD